MMRNRFLSVGSPGILTDLLAVPGNQTDLYQPKIGHWWLLMAAGAITRFYLTTRRLTAAKLVF